MEKQFNRLKERVSLLGNHHQKFIRNIEKYGGKLIGRLEDEGLIENVHLWKSAYNLSKEMDIIVHVASDLKEKKIFLGCYYAFQILHLNLRSIDVLRFNLTSADNKLLVYKNFMLDVGKEFQLLNSTYMQKLLHLLSESEKLPEFIICSVGSLAHQDDIDIGIIDDGSPERIEFNRTIGKLYNEMFKWAIEMHMYLSEHVGEQNYSASIPEFKQLLNKEIGDFVIISEMIMGVPILGNRHLYNNFERKIIRPYYYHSNRDNLYHEGYLRGILGEVRSLLIRQIDQDMLNPKDDGLRMLLGMVLAGRTIFRIYHGNRWEVLATLRKRDPSRQEIYKNLENSLTFLEIFRHLYQLFSAQEEEIYLDDPSIIEQLQLVARTLGYQDVGAIKAWDHLLIHYHEYVQIAKDAAPQLLEDVIEHLRLVSRFTPMMKAARQSGQYRSYAGNLAIDFLRKTKFFKGTKFWDDILEALSAKDSHVLENFIKDLRLLKPLYQKLIIEKYCENSHHSFYTIISFLVLLAKNKRKLTCEDIFIAFNKSFLHHVTYYDDRIIKFSKVFRQFPKTINDYLKTLEAEDQKKFLHLLEGDLWNKEDAASKEKLIYLCRLHYENSHYFTRFFVRIINNYPEYIQYLQDTIKLQQLAKGFLGCINSLPTYERKKKQLGNYYDIEFLRVGLETIQGASIEKTNAEFTEFSDTYLQTLFEICKQNVDEELGKTIPTRDLFAVFAAGGHGREQAFDDDYDIIIFLNDNEPEVIKYINKIVVKMNAEIIKRGTMPHYRFADYFGRFVTLIHELDDYLTNGDDYIFIDKSQILGARMIVGSTKFEKDFEERIIKPHIYDKCEQYIQQMVGEIKSRHESIKINKYIRNNIKEDIGGLRDIEMVLLMYKAKYGLREPINEKLMESLCNIIPDHHDRLCALANSFNFLKNFRDLYRLTVSAENELNMEYLDRVAHIMGFQDSKETPATQQLIKKYNLCTAEVNDINESLIEELGL